MYESDLQKRKNGFGLWRGETFSEFVVSDKSVDRVRSGVTMTK